MTPAPGTAELKINAVRYGGWKRVSVTRSIEQMSGAFDLDITDRWPGQPQSTPIRPGERCQLTLDGQPVITGWVDAVSPDYDANQHGIRVAGRDSTCDLVDCSAIHKTGQWHNVKVDQLAKDLLKPFDVGLVVEADVGEAIDSFDIEAGESVFDCLLRAARMRALLLTSNPEGQLVITRAGRTRIDVALVEGRNIKGARAEFSWRERFSEIHIKGQDRLGGDGDTDYASPEASSKDDIITRHRPLIVIADAHGANVTFAQRAEWERNIRRGRSCRGSITVQGWTRQDGALWLPNTLVSVTSPLLWLQDAEMLIVGCTYTLDDQSGTLTELAIARPGAFDLLEGVSQSQLFKKLKTREQRRKQESVEDWSWM
jgi:prophage tail gpP-like protein